MVEFNIKSAKNEEKKFLTNEDFQYLSDEYRNIIIKVGEVCDLVNERAFVVGGIVRDILLKEKADDLDFICTNIDKIVNTLLKLYPISIKDVTNLKTGVKDIGEKITETYRTKILLFNKEKIDFVEPRKESYIESSIKPIVSIGTLEDDTFRRDFTINTLKIGITKEDWLLIYDDTNKGLNDLYNRILDTPIDPDLTFQQDPTRMLRAVRFNACKNMKFSKRVFNSIKKNKKQIHRVPKELIHKEFIKGCKCNNFFRVLNNVELLDEIIPEIKYLKNLKQNPKFHTLDVFNHSLNFVDNLPNISLLRLAGLLHDIGKYKTTNIELKSYKHEIIGSNITEKILRDLKFSRKDIRYITSLIESHMSLHFLMDSSQSIKAMRKFIGKYNDILPELIQFTRADILSDSPKKDIEIKKLNSIIEKLRNTQFNMQELIEKKFKLSINGFDIKNLGYEGKEIGIIKEFIKNKVIEGQIENDRNVLLNYISNNSEDLLNKNKPKLIILIGVPSSGKSTIRKKEIERFRKNNQKLYTLSPDEIRFKILNSNKTNIYFDISKEKEVWNQVYKIFNRRVSKNQNIILDATNVKVSNRIDFIKKAKANNYYIKAIFLKIHPELANLRQKKRKRQVEKSIIYQKYFDIEKPTIKEGFDEIKIINNYANKKECKLLNGVWDEESEKCKFI